MSTSNVQEQIDVDISEIDAKAGLYHTWKEGLGVVGTTGNTGKENLSMIVDITGALFTLRIPCDYTQTRCKDVASDDNVH